LKERGNELEKRLVRAAALGQLYVVHDDLERDRVAHGPGWAHAQDQQPSVWRTLHVRWFVYLLAALIAALFVYTLFSVVHYSEWCKDNGGVLLRSGSGSIECVKG